MTAALVRGACPSLAAPMPTGDGLLARINPIDGGIAPSLLARLAEAAHEFGSGIIEVTSRGSLQIRGLTEGTAPRLAEALAAAGLPAGGGLRVETGPLAGLDPTELADPRPLARALRRQAADAGLPERLAPKLCVIVDGGGALGLAGVAADLRLSAVRRGAETIWNLALAGTARAARPLGAVSAEQAPAAIARLLELIAAAGARSRGADLDTKAAMAVLAGLPLLPFVPETPAAARPSVGPFGLRGASCALGVGLAFGQARADDLARLARTAEALGAASVVAAPGRSLLIAGLAPERAADLAGAARALGFIVEAGDARLAILSCAGAPVCASANLATKALAAQLLEAAPALFDGAFRLHISGCAKRCGAPARTDLTVVGTATGTMAEWRDRTGMLRQKNFAAEGLVDLFRRAAQHDRGGMPAATMLQYMLEERLADDRKAT